MTRASWAMFVFLVGCGASSRPSGSADSWQQIEAAVEAICRCADVACVDREAKDWWDLPWPELRGASRATHERSIALGERGNRCQLAIRAKPDLDQLAAWAQRTCACADAGCANAVDDEAVAWSRRMEHEPVGGRILAVGHAAVVERDRCFAKLAGGTPIADEPLPATVVERIAATADRICGCATLACADLFDNELVDWIGSQYHRLGKDPTTGMVLAGPAKDANARYQKCHAEKSTKWPHRSRLASNYGIEP